jgi:hypothetical protein
MAFIPLRCPTRTSSCFATYAQLRGIYGRRSARITHASSVIYFVLRDEAVVAVLALAHVDPDVIHCGTYQGLFYRHALI